ncbi:hypothetical protein NKR23_g4545 [Pleurostoma richardsiae]|uniref:Nephrocystin 3-like N-terminal domain-containing protein n=1 Tax=Pleurostoma richardsiae TaxID=41990 RepID=A0AA38RUY2_9PEZI|nr:hypothetical protein NKR23_g4545 [Pleurostoma richardsiae]
MDPVTAFGLAGAVVQFLEFSSKLVKGAVEVYHSTSGVTAELRDLDITTNDLKALTQRLRVPAPNGHLSPGDQNLIVLKEECGRLSDELLAAIQATTAKTSGSKLASLRASYKAVTTKKKLASLSARLDRYRTQVIGIVLGMLNDDFSSTKLLLESSIQEHAKGSRATRDEIRQARDTLTATIQSEIRRSQNTGEPTATQDILTAIHQSLMKIDTALHTVGREDKILHRLWFSHLGSRERTVENAHKNTYRWLLYDSHIKTPASDDILLRWEAKLHVQKRTCFLEWLRAKSGIFYISGKAGSGKSTLMKFVAHEDRTRQELEGWAQASGKTLILARFFFWISGNSLERSLEGLYRSILWDILRQCPSMIPIVFPTAWSSNIDITSMPPNSERPFDMTELQAAINQLFGNKKTMFNYKVCCFIDGLDEYEGDYWAFAKNLSSWASASENIKFCLSSRPHEEFRRHFASDPLTHMKLHELTRGDMYLFVESQFDQDERFEAFRDEDNQGSQHFIESIIKKSEGVFFCARNWTPYRRA